MTELTTSHCIFQNQPCLLSSFLEFEQKITHLAGHISINLSDYEIDHIAVRVNTEEAAKYWMTLLLKCGKILSDNRVNGRPIYLIELSQPLIFLGKKIHIIELPFPKDKQYVYESWEHVEIVMPFLFGESVPSWVQRITTVYLGTVVERLQIKVSEPKVDGEQLSNPSIAISFIDKSDNHTCIKIHPYHIKEIIKG